MKSGALIKIKQASQIYLGEQRLENKLAIWLKCVTIERTKWHLIMLCGDNRTQAVFNLKAEVLDENKNR